jgi:hypothetical protein
LGVGLCHMGDQDPCKFALDYFVTYSMSH